MPDGSSASSPHVYWTLSVYLIELFQAGQLLDMSLGSRLGSCFGRCAQPRELGHGLARAKAGVHHIVDDLRLKFEQCGEVWGEADLQQLCFAAPVCIQQYI